MEIKREQWEKLKAMLSGWDRDRSSALHTSPSGKLMILAHLVGEMATVEVYVSQIIADCETWTAFDGGQVQDFQTSAQLKIIYSILNQNTLPAPVVSHETQERISPDLAGAGIFADKLNHP